MVPQNGHQPGRPQQPSFPANVDASPFLLDSPQVAKQMAALTAANQARIAQNSRIPTSSLPAPGGTSSASYLGGINNSHSFPSGGHDLLTTSSNGHANFQIPNNYALPNSSANSFLDPSMSQPGPSRNQHPPNSPLKQRQLSFLQGLAGLFAKRGTPLPPSLTGVPSPNYDPNTTVWTIIEPSSEVGSFRLAGKDVDLFKLWGLVLQHGGGPAVTNANAWGSILHQFDLPEHFPEMQANGSASVATMLSQYYMAILHPFEELYKKNMQEQQKKAQLSQQQRQGGMPGQQFPNPMAMGRPGPGMPNIQQQQAMRSSGSNNLMSQGMTSNGLAQFPQMHGQNRPLQNPHQMPAPESHGSLTPSEIDPLAHSVDSNLLDQDMQGIKRKHDQDDRDSKRVRQKTDPPESGSMLMSMSSDSASSLQNGQSSQPPSGLSRQQPMRRKIEYVPLAREVHSYGGRDLQALDAEWNNVVFRRSWRDINDWGTIDIECLSMSIRSRLAVELSYALTTLTLLSTMRGQSPNAGFPIYQCPDLMDDVLDLMEDLAFGGPERTQATASSKEGELRIITNRELVSLVHDTQDLPFASLQSHQGSKDSSSGPLPRPGMTIMTIVNAIRNLCMFSDNLEFLSNHPRLIDMLLRLCDVEQAENEPPSPASKNLSLSDLLMIRKDTLYVLMCTGGYLHLSNSPTSPRTYRLARRAFELCASYLVDPAEAVSPLASVQIAGVPPTPNHKPPALADIALDAFIRFSHIDSNRQVIAKAIPCANLFLLLTNLVHRLPLLDADFMLMQREYWLSFVEKLVMSIYSLLFLGPYELKQKTRLDRRLAFKNIVLRLVQKAVNMQAHEGRINYTFLIRRAIESMKLLDKGEELVDTSEPTMPVLSFGMGFSDGNDSGLEKGTGMLGGSRDFTWSTLMSREITMDEISFNELDSMIRVECQ